MGDAGSGRAEGVCGGRGELLPPRVATDHVERCYLLWHTKPEHELSSDDGASGRQKARCSQEDAPGITRASLLPRGHKGLLFALGMEGRCAIAVTPRPFS